MKKLSKTYKELGIDFSFPIKINDANGNETYYEDSSDYWYKHKYDANGNKTYFESSDGQWYKYEYDDNGDRTYYENSEGYKRGTPKSTNQ